MRLKDDPKADPKADAKADAKDAPSPAAPSTAAVQSHAPVYGVATSEGYFSLASDLIDNEARFPLIPG